MQLVSSALLSDSGCEAEVAVAKARDQKQGYLRFYEPKTAPRQLKLYAHPHVMCPMRRQELLKHCHHNMLVQSSQLQHHAGKCIPALPLPRRHHWWATCTSQPAPEVAVLARWSIVFCYCGCSTNMFNEA